MFNLCCVFVFFALITLLFLFRKSEEKAAVAASAFSGSTVVIDAGHGGEDGGATGNGNILEKEINLQISKRLECLFNFAGIDTEMIRRDDVSLCTDESMSLRQRKNADLKMRVNRITSISNAVLISVHQNSFPEDKGCRGAQVFYSDRNAESYDLAKNIQTVLTTKIDSSNERTEKRIPDSVYLMKKINCPAVLVECGFLTNEEESQRLLDSLYQIKLAAGILSGYINYKK